MRISVIGCGYLGAVHAAAMASLGHDVIGIDVDPLKVAALSRGRAPFYEPQLDTLLAEGTAHGTLSFSTDPADARGCRIHFIAVGTPQSSSGTSADLRYLDAAITDLVPWLQPGDVIAGKSTVPVGTASRLQERLDADGIDATVVWNPEFLREGHAVADTLRPDRIVYGMPSGARGEMARSMLDELYQDILAAGTPLVVGDLPTAELVKMAANAFLATKISFINAVSDVAAAAGADITTLAEAIGYDERIGSTYLRAGLGFGGGCLPKDIRAFRARADELGIGDSLAFLREIDAVNDARRQRLVALVSSMLPGSGGTGRLDGRRVAVLGLAFKPDSDDVRDSPALDVAVRLKGLGADVVATDPRAIANARRQHPQLRYEPDMMRALQRAEVIVLTTEWREYTELDPLRVRAVSGPSAVVDGRNALDGRAWASAGFRYIGMGVPVRDVRRSDRLLSSLLPEALLGE